MNEAIVFNLANARMYIPPTMVTSRQPSLWKKAVIGIWHMLTGQKVDQPCLLRSELGYMLLHAVDPWADYRINVVLAFYNKGNKGHAWLTRNGRILFHIDSDKVKFSELTIVGNTDKYTYYIKERNLHNWYSACQAASTAGESPLENRS